MEEKEYEKGNKGITLIALVITVIVLLILAGVAISMLSGENGILRQAARAKTETGQKSTEEAVKLAAMTALTAGNGKIEGEQAYQTLNKELKEAGYTGTEITDLPAEIDINGNKYKIGEDGTSKRLVWYYTKDKKITNGKITLELGDKINYNSGKDENENAVTAKYKSPKEKNGYGDQEYLATSYTGEWRVLGVEDGQILIMPTTNVTTTNNSKGYYYLGSYSSSADLKNAYQYAEEELDEIGKVYGQGKGASGGRSIKVEDVNKLTGFDETTYRIGEICGFGNEVKYSCGNEGKTNYSWDNGGTPQTGTSNGSFTYLDKNTWKTLKPGESVKLKCSYYYYDNSTKPEGMNQNTYDLLFKETDSGQHYWLWSSCILTNPGDAVFFCHRVLKYYVEGCYFVTSDGGSKCDKAGVRPAVSLKSDITLTPDGANNWKIQ